MICTEIEEFLLDYTDGRLDSKLVPLIKGHIGKCKHCEALYHAHLEVDGAMTKLMWQPTLPADFAAYISRSTKAVKSENMHTAPPTLVWDFVGSLGVAIAGALIALRLVTHITASLVPVIAALIFSIAALLIVFNTDSLPD